MPTFDTTTYTAQKPDRSNPSRLLSPNIASGEVEFAIIPYTAAGTETAADVIRLGYLPAGCIPIPELSKVTFSADPGTTLLLDVGTDADLDGWCDGITASAGGQVEFGSSSPMPAWLVATPLVEDSATPGLALVKATLAATSATITASVIWYFVLAFKRGR